FVLGVLAGCDNVRGPASSTKLKSSDDGKPQSAVLKVEKGGKQGVDAETKARKGAEKTKIKAKLDGVDDNVNDRQDHAAKEIGDAKKKLDDEIKDLQSKRDDLQKKHDKIDTTEASAWDNFVTELNKTADSVSESTKRAADRFKK